jgi:RimJ/RimL family protein N-acetyltransferase
VIETDRLELRPFREADRAPFAAINGDPEVGAWLGGTLGPAASDALIERINGHILRHGFGFWAAERKADGRLVGAIGLMRVEAGNLPVGPCVEIGWRLAREAWGGGLATEGARAALAWGFNQLKLAEIVAFTAATNTRSQGVMRRLGMVHDPARDFDHPRLAQDSPLRRHVVFVAGR